MDYSEIDMFKMINAKSDYHNIAEYIIMRFPTKFGIEEAKEIAEIFVKSNGFTKEEILSGQRDKQIYEMIKLFIYKPKSVVNKQPQKQAFETETIKPSPSPIEVALKTIKKNIDPKTAAKFTAYTLAASMLFGFYANNYRDIKRSEEISEDLGMMASQTGSYDYEHKINIVNQNDYVASRKQNGDAIIAYHNDKIAMDIVNICTQNIELFDICIYDVYFNMEYNRLENMDSVLRYLKSYLEKEESLQPVYAKISDCSVFLDYIIKSGVISSESEEYAEIKEAIKNYKNAKRDYEVAFNGLSKSDQRRINDLISGYKGLKDEYYKKYIIIKNNGENQLFELSDSDPNFGGRA